MTRPIKCFLQHECPVAEAGCVFCFARWLEVLPLLPGGVAVPQHLPVILHSETENACCHLGSKRRCCEDLWICRMHRCDCTRSNREDIDAAVRRCSECTDFVKTEDNP